MCSYTVTSQGGQSRIITASGEAGTIVRKVKIIVNKIAPTIKLGYWQEISDF